jgi:DNA integrity scanning protein DisA with diadenylate cyclase activity
LLDAVEHLLLLDTLIVEVVARLLEVLDASLRLLERATSLREALEMGVLAVVVGVQPSTKDRRVLEQKRIYTRVFTQAHKLAAQSVLTDEERSKQMTTIVEKLQTELAPDE